MKHVILVLKFVTAPAWVPLWMMKKGGRVLVMLVVAAFLSGCASTSNKFDKSPCACDFKPLNTGHYRSDADA